tara:strand:- start:2652 stop:2903 length:252 start_codon:yes stop_codon:yes gene_type:complete
MQPKTYRSVQFEITEQTRIAIGDWIPLAQPRSEDFMLHRRIDGVKHLVTRQYAPCREACGNKKSLDASIYGTHNIRRSKVSLI